MKRVEAEGPRRLRWAVGASLACTLAAACSPKVREVGGLELVIWADGLSAPEDFDELHVEITQELEGGAYTNIEYLIPQDAMLPATFAIVAGTNADQQADIRITALLGSSPVVQREALVQVPRNRWAELPMALARRCAGQVKAVGAEGNVESSCPMPGDSCQPDTGMCGSSVVDPSKLTTYTPGDVDAAMVGSGPVEIGNDASIDRGGSSMVPEAADPGPADANAEPADVSPEAPPSADAGSDGEAGVGSLLNLCPTLDEEWDLTLTGDPSADEQERETTWGNDIALDFAELETPDCSIGVTSFFNGDVSGVSSYLNQLSAFTVQFFGCGPTGTPAVAFSGLIPLGLAGHVFTVADLNEYARLYLAAVVDKTNQSLTGSSLAAYQLNQVQDALAALEAHMPSVNPSTTMFTMSSCAADAGAQ